MDLVRLFERSPAILEVGVGDTVFSQGDRGKAMYVILEGTVEIRIGDKSLETVDAGGFFGEMALIDSDRRSATVVAQTNCRLAVVNEERFLSGVQQTPTFALQVMRILVRRLRQMDRRI